MAVGIQTHDAEKYQEMHIDKVSDLDEVPAEMVDENAILTQAEQRKLGRKLDLRLLPIVWLLYFINLLDRAAVGAAAAHGFRTDLKLRGNQYNIAISVFFIFYCLAEVPSNLILKKVGARYWLPAIALSFGLVSLGTAFIHTYGQFIVVRVFLAITEAGTSPGISYFLTTYYSSSQLSFRIPLFLSGGALSSGIGAFIANGYVGLGQITPSIYGWRNIFFFNSIITFGLAFIALLVLPPSPEKAKMLTEKERTFIMARSKRMTAGRASEEGTKVKLVLRTFVNPFVLFGVVYLFVGNLINNALTFFLAIVLQTEFHYSGNKANVYTGGVFLATFGVTIAVGYSADRARHSAGFMLALMVLALIGSCMFAYGDAANTRYAGVYLASFGGFVQASLCQGWIFPNLAPYTVRATGSAFVNSIGSLGGIVSAWVFVPAQAARNYPNGRIILTTFTCIGVVTVISHVFFVIWDNKQREQGKRDWRLENSSPEEIDQLGSLHPHFRWSL